MMKRLFLILAAMMVSVACAIDIPKASAKALGVTKGKKCEQGVVFVNGKYLESPYFVERWGTGIRINGTPVIGQVVDWNEFLKTQPNVKVTKSEAPAADESAVEDEPEDDLDDMDMDDDDDSLDDLFDDDPKPAKKAAKKPAPKKKAPKKAKKPAAKVTYTLEGDFVANDKSKALLARVNKKRTEVNSRLLNGGIYFFGDRYAAVAADARTAEQVLTALPDILRKAQSAADVISSTRSAGLVYITNPICNQLFANKRDYIKLQQRRDKMVKEREFKKLMNNSGSAPLL